MQMVLLELKVECIFVTLYTYYCTR